MQGEEAACQPCSGAASTLRALPCHRSSPCRQHVLEPVYLFNRWPVCSISSCWRQFCWKKDCCLRRQGVSSWDVIISAQSPESPMRAPRCILGGCTGWVPRYPTWPCSHHPAPLPCEMHTLILFSTSPGFKWCITWALLKSKLDVFCASLFYLKFLTTKIWLIILFFSFCKHVNWTVFMNVYNCTLSFSEDLTFLQNYLYGRTFYF